VLKGEPDWQALPAETPQSIRVLLRRCLQKDAKQRFRDAGDIRIQIEEAHATPMATVPTAAAPVPSRVLWRWMSLTGLACVLGGGIISGLAVWRMKPAPPQPVSRMVVNLSAGQRLDGLNTPALALSPDGTQLAYVASDSAGPQRLYVRPIDSLEARPIAGTEDASAPFFSPDGQWIGFFAAGKLKKVQISGGAALTLGDVVGNPMGASWGPNDSIVVAPVALGGLSMVSAAGGALQPLTTLKDETSHRWPEFVPGGNAILFTVSSGGAPDDSQIEVQRLDTGERKVLIRGGTYGRYVPTGHLVYYRAGTVMAAPFDLARLAVTGLPAPVLEGVMSSTLNTGAGEFSLSNSGSLVYLPGGPGENDLRMVWVDRKGTAEFLPAPPRAYGSPRLSPDGRFAAVTIGNDVWVYDLVRDTLTRLTFEGRNAAPQFTPDGKRVWYNSARAGAQSIFWKLADGSGPEELLITSTNPRPGSMTPDGRTLLFGDNGPKTASDIWVLPLEGERKPHVFLQTPFGETTPRLSPDGRWVAYLSSESGKNEVYVRPFPGPGGKWQISAEGGQGIAWSPKGNELFYRAGAKMMVVDIRTQPTFSAGKPRLLFETPQAAFQAFGAVGADYSVSADGQRFLMVRPGEQAQTSLTQINVVMNWFEELKRRAPLR
jgi:serine/threonine-protein kinase